MNGELRVLTVGHSTHSIESFIALLKQNSVTAIADVRSAPFSQYAPQFNRGALRQSLAVQGIGYVFLGRELGARSDDRSCYVDGRVRYSLLAKTALFRSGIDRVVKGASTERIAIMCTEKDPLDCHRTLLVARTLSDESVKVDHILSDGRLESHQEAMLRLLEKFGLPAVDLFRSTAELIDDASLRQERRIAFVDPSLVSAPEKAVP